MEEFDIIVIGGGPAGSTFAAHINGADLKVLLLEERTLDVEYKEGMRKKPCSGLVAVPAQKILKKLNLAIPEAIKVSPSTVGLKIYDHDTKREIITKEKIINVDRQKFDRWLFGNIPGTINIRTGARYIKHYLLDGRVIVQYKVGESVFEVRAKVLVASDGANSKVREIVKPFDPVERYVGAEWMLKVDERFLEPNFKIILNENLTDHYLWTVPKDGLLHVGGAFSRFSDSAQRRKKLMNSLTELGLIPDNYDVVSNWSHYIARPVKREFIFEGNAPVHFIGEAAGLVCPNSAEGYSYALASGFELANFMNKNFVHTLRSDKMFQFKALRNTIWMQNLKRAMISKPVFRKSLFGILGKSILLKGV